MQILDSYNNKTYVNGMVASIYKQSIPLANPMRKPGEWQVYDVVWTAPSFNAEGSLKSPAYVTAFLNGVLVENHFELKGETRYIGQPFYKKFDRAPIKLQAHGDRVRPSASGISGSGSWIRGLGGTNLRDLATTISFGLSLNSSAFLRKAPLPLLIERRFILKSIG